MSILYKSNKKYLVSSMVFDKHYNPEFMKHVLPKLPKPHRPRLDCFKNILFISIWFSVSTVTLLSFKSFSTLLLSGS